MPCSFITFSGVVSDVKQSENKTIATIFPTAENAPPIIVSAYGDNQRLVGLNGQFSVISGKVIHTGDSFMVDLAECWITSDWGSPIATAVIVGKVNLRYAEKKQTANGKEFYTFQVSYYTGKENGKAKYYNWRVKVWGGSIPYYEKLGDGDNIALTNCRLSWSVGGKDKDKVYLEAVPSGFPLKIWGGQQ